MSSRDPIGLRSHTTNGAMEGDRLGSGRVVGNPNLGITLGSPVTRAQSLMRLGIAASVVRRPA